MAEMDDKSKRRCEDRIGAVFRSTSFYDWAMLHAGNGTATWELLKAKDQGSGPAYDHGANVCRANAGPAV